MQKLASTAIAIWEGAVFIITIKSMIHFLWDRVSHGPGAHQLGGLASQNPLSG